VVVAVPARDEAESMAECIRAVDQAAAEVPVPVLVVVAADSCTDDTFEIAHSTATQFCELAVIEGTWGRAGAARFAAVEFGLDMLPAADGPVWIANTDADCLVPPLWLRVQLELAVESDAVAGIVELDPTLTEPALMRAFTETYILDGEHHGHVHGANIGMCASAYRAVGGWCLQTVVGEDHVLWDAMRDVGHRMRQTTALRVVTSARTRSRVLGGFATDLDNLDVQRLELLATGSGVDVRDVA
jgi:glycosyltransferase involved in cell wall biosynthesis